MKDAKAELIWEASPSALSCHLILLSLIRSKGMQLLKVIAICLSGVLEHALGGLWNSRFMFFIHEDAEA